MTLYIKPRSEVFASNAPESEISTFTAWLRGLGIAFDETNGLPEMSGLNNVFNLLNQYIKYLEQNGFAEWSSELEYPIGAGVRVGAVWYRAKTRNTSKPPSTSQNDWELFLNANALSYENPIYIENNVVKIRSASQTQSGVLQFASASEVSQKVNVSKAINPANVAQMFVNRSESIELPNNLRIQMKTFRVPVVPSNIGAVLSFDVFFNDPFLSTNLVSMLTNMSGTGIEGNEISLSVSSRHTNRVSIMAMRVSGSNTGGVEYFDAQVLAIGY